MQEEVVDIDICLILFAVYIMSYSFTIFFLISCELCKNIPTHFQVGTEKCQLGGENCQLGSVNVNLTSHFMTSVGCTSITRP